MSRFWSLMLVAPLSLLIGCAGEVDYEENVGEVQLRGAGVSPFLELLDIDVDDTFVVPCVEMPRGIRTAAERGADFSVTLDIAFEDGTNIEATVPIANMERTRTISSNRVVLETRIDTGRVGIAPCIDLSSAVLDTPGGRPSGGGDVVEIQVEP